MSVGPPTAVHSHWGSRGGGQSAIPDSEIFAKNRGKEGENQKKKKQEKEGKIGKKRKNREGSFTLPLLTDRTGYATAPLWLRVIAKKGSSALYYLDLKCCLEEVFSVHNTPRIKHLVQCSIWKITLEKILHCIQRKQAKHTKCFRNSSQTLVGGPSAPSST